MVPDRDAISTVPTDLDSRVEMTGLLVLPEKSILRVLEILNIWQYYSQLISWAT